MTGHTVIPWPEMGTFYIAAFGAGTTLVLLLLAELARRSMGTDLKAGNDAQRLGSVGEVLGVFVIAGATVHNAVAGASVLADVAACSIYGGLGLLASTVAGRLGVRLLLGSTLPREVARGNGAAGVAASGQMLASALVTSRAISGSDLQGVGLSLVFFVIAQATLLGFVTLFRALTAYDDSEQIHGENLAAAVSYAGVTVAIAIVVGRAVEGDFEGWLTSLRGYGGVLLSLVALYPVRQIFVQSVLLRAPLHLYGGALDKAIAERRSTGLAALEAGSYLATAIVITELA
jgi:uncharacterized membrane protein YjfL (UPF0719 family)